MFSPKILRRSKQLSRKLDVSTLLYGDALRRQEKEQCLQESERRQMGLLMSPKINRNTNALVLRRISSEFGELVAEEEPELNPLVALSVLEEIFNVNLNPHQQSPSYQPVQQLVALLTSHHFEGTVSRPRLWELIALVVAGEAETALFTPEEQRTIAEEYHYFYKSRVARERKSPTPEKCSFRPKTLEASTQLAHSFRQKTCREIDHFVENQKLHLNVDTQNYTL
jgi:hypothetical protein